MTALIGGEDKEFNTVELSILELPPPPGAPLIGRSFGDAELRGPGGFRPVISHPRNRLEDLREYLDSPFPVMALLERPEKYAKDDQDDQREERGEDCHNEDVFV